MVYKTSRIRSISVVFSILIAVVVGAAGARASELIPGEYLVKYRDHSFVAIPSIKSIAGVRVASHNPFGHLLKVHVDPREQRHALEALVRDPNVAYVVPNVKVHMFRAPLSTEQLKDQWAIKQIHAPEAWNRAGNKGSRKIIVGVIDTGADYNHDSLKANMVAGFNFKDNNNDPLDKTGSANPGHGTHCSGIIGATGLVDGGTVGVSPDVSIMPLRFLDESGQGDLNSAIQAIDYAIQKHVSVISASWGATISRQQALPLVEAVKRADDAGVTFVVAAANDGKNNDKTEVYPANAGWPNTIAVAASGPNDEKPSWSNYGTKTIHVAAPGLNIMSTLPGNKYGNLSGTSMATPLVAGLVAFLKAQNPSLSGAQIRALLQLTGAKAQIETACHCRVDALASVDALLNQKLFITPAAATVGQGETIKFAATFGRAPFKFTVADASVGTITDGGEFKAVKNGTTKVTVTDAGGQSSTSLEIVVGASSSGGGGGGGGSPIPWPGEPGEPGQPGQPGQPPGDGSCPLGDQQLCDIICQIQPDQPFCKK